MDKTIKTLSRDEYRLYLSRRKPLDKDFTKLTINKYEENRKSHDEKMELKRIEHHERMKADEKYRDAYREKTRKAYERAKQKRLDKSEIKSEPVKQEPIQPTQTIVVSTVEPTVVPVVVEQFDPVDYSDFGYDF